MAVAQEALRWVGTPYRNCSDVLGGGIDCSMLLVRAWVDSGLVEPFDPRPYPSSWYLHRSEERYLAWMREVAVEVEQPQLADVVLWRFGRCYSHSGIVTRVPSGDDCGEVVHAMAMHGRCSRSSPEEAWLAYERRGGRRLRLYFDVVAMMRRRPDG